MKTIIITSHSPEFRQLAGMTVPNVWKYTARHGYDFMTIRKGGWFEMGPMEAVRDLLMSYDMVVLIGSDIVFTNMTKKFDDITQDGDSLVIAREHLETNFPFNNDVSIWRRGTATNRLLDQIIAAEEEWKGLTWSWQEWLNVHWDKVEEYVRLVPAREMNSCHQEGEGKWQPGDFIFHAMGYGLEDKMKLCRYYLQAVKE